MAMLAEPRRKQKWALNPRGKHWSEDSNKFGQKMLEKMGWSSGKGLGANLDGMTDHIRLRYKNDQAGIGFSHDDRDKQWTQHQEGFNELLQKLHNGETTSASTRDNELSGKSLELKSKQSRARVHYQKFTRGKDINKYSTKDLANIFGKKNLDEKSEAPERVLEIKVEIEESPEEPVGSSDTSHGVMTIKGGSITDYFKNKISHLGKKSISDDQNDSDSDRETRAGFGFASVKTEVKSPENDKLTPLKHFGLENPALHLTSPNNKKYASISFTSVKPEVESTKESKDTPRYRKIDFVYENPAVDIVSPKNENETPRKRKSDFVFENPCLELGSTTPEVDRTPKRRRSEFIYENGGLDLETVPQSIKLDVPSGSSLPITEKKKRKKKSKECSRPSEGFANEALNLEVRSRDEEISSVSQFEVPRRCFGVANDALDLADETTGKKRVTFNETVEYDTDSAKARNKNKKGGKLDKFEVDNAKLKKKRKKSRRVEVESVFVNEAMDVEILSQEAHDNASNERKSERARKKRERRTLNLETIDEAPEEEKDNVPKVVTLDKSLVGEASEDLEVLSLKTPKKKKKKKKNKVVAESEGENNLDTTIDTSEEVEDIDTSESSKIEKKSKKQKKREPEIVTIEETQQNSSKKSKKRKPPIVICDPEEEMEVVNLEETVVAKKDTTKKNLPAVESTSMDKENVEVLATENGEGSKRSKKQRKVKNSMEIEDTVEKFEEKRAENTPDMQNGPQSPWDGKVKKSKKIFKALFARSPIVHFAGSNINEIKGYGMDI